MNKIEKTFTYAIADDYLSQTALLGKTGEWTYNGPDKIWIFISKEDNKYAGRFLTADGDGETCPTPLDMYKVCIDSEDNPLLLTLIGAGDRVNYDELPQYTEELPCGGVYQRVMTPPPDHTYEMMEMVYDLDKEEFIKPYPFKKPHITWEDLRRGRTHALNATDYKISDGMPTEVADAWTTYRQSLRDLPQTYGATNATKTPTIDPWKTQPVYEPGEVRP